MNPATSAAMIAANIAAQNAMRNSSGSGSGRVYETEAPVVIAAGCLFLIAIIVGVPLVQFALDHPIISVLILVVVFVLCAVWYCVC